MELLTYTILLTAQQNFPHSFAIQSETVKFLDNVSNAMLISNNLASWKDFQFPFLLSLSSFHNPGKQITPAYIIDLRDIKITYEKLNQLPRNPSTRFVFIITEENISLLQTPYYCNALFLIITAHDLNITISVDHCKGIGSLTTKGHNCKGNVSFMHFPPNVIFNGKELDGTEGKVMQTSIEHLELSINYVNRHQKEWGSFDPPSGLQGDVSTGSSIAAFGALYGFVKRFNYSEILFSDSVTKLSWAVPKGIGPSQPTWSIVFVSEFSTFVWFLTLFTYIALIPIAHLLKHSKQNSSVTMNILGLILGIPPKLILSRGASLSIIVFGFLLTSYYRSMMSSKLTVPGKPPSIQTLKELVESGLDLAGPPSAFDIVLDIAKASPGDKAKTTLVGIYKPSFDDLNEILTKITEDKNISYLRYEANYNYEALKNPQIKSKIHVVEEPLSSFYPITLFPKHSCLAAQFQRIQRRLCESGLSSKWTKELTTSPQAPNSNNLRKLAFEHIKGIVFLLLFGWIVSFIVFVGELIAFNVIKLKKSK